MADTDQKMVDFFEVRDYDCVATSPAHKNPGKTKMQGCQDHSMPEGQVLSLLEASDKKASGLGGYCYYWGDSFEEEIGAQNAENDCEDENMGATPIVIDERETVQKLRQLSVRISRNKRKDIVWGSDTKDANFVDRTDLHSQDARKKRKA
ncbi:hypothetical protein B0O99DRAFT_690610 [Bisporella sp. PMI_857]|nr:hypothetical protein B0O99DRAFT_690610 [Bisporella sp. PMI_857]